jgi:hypothetical protein
MNAWFWGSLFFMCISLWVAFGKRFRPITRGTFYLNLFSVVVNGVSAAHHFYNWASK